MSLLCGLAGCKYTFRVLYDPNIRQPTSGCLNHHVESEMQRDLYELQHETVATGGDSINQTRQ